MNSGLPRISGARRFVGDASTALAVAGEKYSPSVAASCAGSGGVILGPCFPGSKLIFTLPPPRADRRRLRTHLTAAAAAIGVFFERRILQRQISRAERRREAEPHHHRVGIQPHVLRVGVAVGRLTGVQRHPEHLHRAVQRPVVADWHAGRAHARNHVLVRRFEFRSVVARVPEFRAGEHRLEHRARLAVGLEIAIRHPLDQRFGRIVGDEVLRQLEAQMLRRGGTARQDIQRMLAFVDSAAFDSVPQKSFFRKVVTRFVEVKSARDRSRAA